MEFLNEKRVTQNRKPIEIQDILLERKVCFMEEKMKQLRTDCVRLYKHRCYSEYIKDYIPVLNRALACCSEILGNNWQEDVLFSVIFKVKAECFLGCVYVSRHYYDDALEYLKEAMKNIETNALQYIIPEFYIHINIEMAKCYLEKHSPVKLTEDCLLKAEAVLNDRKDDICREYNEFYFNKLYLELKLQQTFTSMDKYGSAKGFDENAAWKLLKDAGQMYKLLSDCNDNSFMRAGFSYSKWKDKQNVTLRTTKGDFFKNLYFMTGVQIDFLRRKDNAADLDMLKKMMGIASILKEEAGAELSQISSDSGEGGKNGYYNAIIQDLRYISEFLGKNQELILKNDNSVRSELGLKVQKLQQYCLEISFAILAGTIRVYKDNTICLDDIAALLYDYNQRTGESSLLLRLLEQHCPEYRKNTVLESVEAVLDKVLETESTNMFALNIKAAISCDFSIPGKMDDYPALRRSSLKKWFVRMKKICKNSPDTFQKIEMSLINLYSQVIKFMNSAIVDYNSEEWKNLRVGHYTRMSVLPKLINKESDARLRIGNVHHLNDPQEGVLMINHMKSLLPVKGDDSLIDELWNLYDSDKSGAVRSSVYMGCFTSRLDQLNMWDRYGDGSKGVSIQFDTEAYFDRDAEVYLAETSTSESSGHCKMENVKYPLYMVIYVPDSEKVSLASAASYAAGRAKSEYDIKSSGLEGKWWEMQSRMLLKLESMEKDLKVSLEGIQDNFMKLDIGTRNNLKRELCNTIMVILDLVRFLIKSDYYRDEREYRVIQYSTNPECEKEGMVVPKLYIPIERELVYDKVCFGPLVTDFESKAAYILNIRKNGNDKEGKHNKIEVHKSSISYKEVK